MPAQEEEVLEDKTVTLSDGSPCKLRLRPATMFAVHRAYRIAGVAFHRETGERGFSPEVFTEEWAKHRVHTWPFKVHVSNGGWRLLGIHDGPIIAQAIGAEEAMATLFANEKEVEEKAKNSPSGPETQSPTPTPQSNSTAGVQ